MQEFTADDAKLTFKLFDQDGNGHISAAELTHVLCTLGDEVTPKDVGSMIAEATQSSNTSASGAIDYAQYEHLVLNTTKSSRWQTALQTKLKRALANGTFDSQPMQSDWAPLQREIPGDRVQQCQAKRSRFLRTRTGTDAEAGVGWQWVHDEVTVRIDLREPFAKGAMRECYRMTKMSTHLSAEDISQERAPSLWKHQHLYVAKRYMELPADRVRKVICNDVKMQMYAKEFAKRYNEKAPPKVVDFLEAFVIELQPDGTIWFVEAFVPGAYHKHNDNAGLVSNMFISGDDNKRLSSSSSSTISSIRYTPQAFSHFTHVISQGDVIVVDIQGVGDLYTDPQVHSRAGFNRNRPDLAQFGVGDLGLAGAGCFYRTHECNAVCRHIGLEPFDRTQSEIMCSPALPSVSSGCRDVSRSTGEAAEGLLRTANDPGTRSLGLGSESDAAAHPSLLDAALDKAQGLKAQRRTRSATMDEADPTDKASWRSSTGSHDLAEEKALLRDMSAIVCKNTRANKTRRLGLQHDDSHHPTLTRQQTISASIAGRTAHGDNEHDLGTTTAESGDQWTEGQEVLAALKLDAGQSSARGLRRYFSQQTETLEGLQHLAVYKSYIYSLPLEMTNADALESSRYHLLRAVELGARGSVDALLDEVQGQPKRLLHGLCVLVMTAVAAVAAVLAWSRTE